MGSSMPQTIKDLSGRANELLTQNTELANQLIAQAHDALLTCPLAEIFISLDGEYSETLVWRRETGFWLILEDQSYKVEGLNREGRIEVAKCIPKLLDKARAELTRTIEEISLM